MPARAVVIAGALVGLVLLGIALVPFFDPGAFDGHAVPGGAPKAADSVAGNEGRAQPVAGGRDVKMGWLPARLDAVHDDRLPPYRETFEDAVLVALEAQMWTWQAGDRVAFSVPQVAETLEAVVETVEVGLGGNRSYIGRLSGRDAAHAVVVTVGERNAFAYIGSEWGSYELFGNREFGWLMPTASMDRHVDYSKPDYIVLPNDARAPP